jgi:hypothetical protein
MHLQGSQFGGGGGEWGQVSWIFGIFYIHNVFSLCSQHIIQIPKLFLITLHFYHISCVERCASIMYISKPKGKT